MASTAGDRLGRGHEVVVGGRGDFQAIGAGEGQRTLHLQHALFARLQLLERPSHLAAVDGGFRGRPIAAGDELHARRQLGRELHVLGRGVARIANVDLVVGRRADILHGGAVDVDLQGGPMDQHVFGQVDVGAAVAVGLDANREVPGLSRGQFDFDRSLVAGVDRAQAMRYRMRVAGIQRHEREQDVLRGAVSAVAQLQLVDFPLAEEHFPRAVQAHRQLGLLDFDHRLRRRLLEVPANGQLERLALPGNDLQRQLLFRMGFDPPQHPAAWIVTILLHGVDLAAAGRRPGHFGPVGQGDRHGDLFGRHVAGILQQDLVGRLLADHDLPRSDGFHRQQRALVIDQNARLQARRRWPAWQSPDVAARRQAGQLAGPRRAVPRGSVCAGQRSRSRRAASPRTPQSRRRAED